MTCRYVIRDPGHGYGLRFARAMRRRFGWRGFAYYSSSEEYRRAALLFPELAAEGLVEGNLVVPAEDMPDLIDLLRHGHDIRAVVPAREPQVVDMARIADALGLDWAQGGTLARFRHKAALQAHVAAVDPALRIKRHVMVSSPIEAVDWARAHDLERFVLKPHDGFGSSHIGVFDRAADLTDVEAHWTSTGTPVLLLEEYLDGPEFTCDGQVDADGLVTVFAVGHTIRVPANGRPTIEVGWVQLHSSDERFQQLAAYATRFLRASGLRRSPFHLELRIDAEGPCAIECAARMVGLRGPLLGLMHGGALDAFDVAAHYYGSAEPYGEMGTDWAAYDSAVAHEVAGLAHRRERILTLDGVAEVEAMPEFRGWVDRPWVGQRVEPTVDVFTCPYGLFLQAEDEPTVVAAAAEAVRRIRWNARPAGPRDVLAASRDVVARQRIRVPLPVGSRIRPQRTGSGAATGTDARVVFVSPGSGTAYAEFAAQLRQAGYTTVLATQERTDWRASAQQLVDRLVFDEVWPVVQVGADGIPMIDDEACARVLAPPTVDVVSDDLLGWRLATYRASHPSDSRVPMVDPSWYDKRVLAQRLEDLGVPGPRTWDDPDDAPLPAVVKGRLTTGGQHVRFCRDRAELDAALAALAGPAGPAFVQEYLPGPVYSTTGVARAGVVLLAETFVQTKPPGEPTAPARHIEVVDCPDLDAVAERVVAATGRTGIFETEQLLDDDGVGRLVDLNPRLPGNWAALHSAGSALFDAYLAVLNGEEPPDASRLPVGATGTSLRVTYNPPWSSYRDFVDWRRYTGAEMRRRRRTHGVRFVLWAELNRERLVASVGTDALRRRDSG